LLLLLVTQAIAAWEESVRVWLVKPRHTTHVHA
jgi:hypothetical protein